tara:strand:+ start:1865 stop:2497 length:633 start_codon:yes stop_codon:yes gene_type:complete
MSILNRVQDLVGEATSFSDENASYNSAINEVIDFTPIDILIKDASLHQMTTNTWTSGGDKKILKVLRRDGDSGSMVPATEISREEWDLHHNTDSIYYRSSFTPKFSLFSDGTDTKLMVTPPPTGTQGADVYYLSYNPGTLSSDSAVPRVSASLEQAIVLKTAINILANKISDAVQDEEDSEILQLLQAQSANLQSLYQVEMSRITGEKTE